MLFFYLENFTKIIFKVSQHSYSVFPKDPPHISVRNLPQEKIQQGTQQSKPGNEEKLGESLPIDKFLSTWKSLVHQSLPLSIRLRAKATRDDFMLVCKGNLSLKIEHILVHFI